MAAKRPLKRYNAKYYTVGLRVLRGEEVFTLSFPSAREARSFRNTFYAFRVSLKEEAQPGSQYERLAQALENTKVSITGTNAVFLTSKEISNEA